MRIKDRFRQFLPVVVDIETAGLNPNTDALLEICAIPVVIGDGGKLVSSDRISTHIEPFEGANLDPKALEFNKIDPFHPFRFAKQENEALRYLFEPIRALIEKHDCQRAVMVAHNAWFDLLFMNAAIKRTGLKSPFHAFTSFDTATLAAMSYGQTVLAVACKKAGIAFDPNEAHSAIYDAEKTAELFCRIANNWRP